MPSPSLSHFIQGHHDKILEEWVAFAKTLLPWAEGMSDKELRDHAEELLTAVVSDMESPQSRSEQSGKSKGNAADGALVEVGKKHASERLDSGLDLAQLVSEYRSLRASVLRLWEEDQGDKQGQVTRFNEAIDEILSKSTSRYSETVRKTRDQFLAILGHDLQNPLNSIIMGATLLTDPDPEDPAELATLILNSGSRMSRMINDLLDLTRTRLGRGIPVTCRPLDFSSVCEHIMAEFKASHPGSRLTFEGKGDLHGEWDGDRLSQVVSNLVANALHYGSEAEGVKVVAQGHGDEVVLSVHNGGKPIPKKLLKKIFDPLVRHQADQSEDKNTTGLGLGLYIASEIVTAHGGVINVTSSENEGTTFTVQIPRHPAAKKDETAPKSAKKRVRAATSPSELDA